MEGSENFNRRLIHWGARVGDVKTGYPSNTEGREGDTQTRFISNLGLYLFKKYKNEWYGVAMTKLSDLKKL
jgi:hypothetical protein